MAATEFFFAIHLSDHRASRAMLHDVVSRVLSLTGCDIDLDGLEAAVATTGATCRVTFVARAGRLDIVVASATDEIWQTTQSLA